MILACFQRFFRNIDIFGIKTELKLDHKLKFTTSCGGFLTMLYLSLFIVLFISTGDDMYHHSNPITSFTKDYSPIPDPALISKEGYFFIFGLQDSSGNHFYDERIYSASLIHKSRSSAYPITKTTSIPLERCSKDHLPSNPLLVDYFERVSGNLSQILCLSRSNLDKFKIKGSWDSVDYETLNIMITRCQATNTTVCKSEEEMNSALKFGYFAFYSTDTIVDLQNYEQPATRIGLDYYTETNLNLTKNVIRYISSTNILSDTGWILKNGESYEYENYERDHESFGFKTNPNEPIIKFQLRKGIYKLRFQRYYKKIQNVLAEMGGFLKITFLIFSFLSYPISTFLYYENISNTLYNFQKGDDDPEFSRRIVGEASKAERKREESQSFREPSFSHIDQDKLFKYFSKLKASPLKMPFYRYLFPCISNDPEFLTKKNQRKKALYSIFSRLDIKYILKKTLEIDKLKFLLLNGDQLQIFDNLPRPTITKRAKININSMDPNRVKSYGRASAHAFENEDKIRYKMRVFTKCFANILSKPELDEIDKKLLNFIGEDLKGIMGISDFLRKRLSSKSEIPFLFEENKKNSILYIPDEKEMKEFQISTDGRLVSGREIE